jgi:hypothetical protein
MSTLSTRFDDSDIELEYENDHDYEPSYTANESYNMYEPEISVNHLSTLTASFHQAQREAEAW